MISFLRWLSHLLTAATIAFCVLLSSHTVGFGRMNVFLFALAAFPVLLYLLYHLGKYLSQRKPNDRAQFLLLVLSAVIIVCVVYYLADRIIVAQNGWKWITFDDFGGDPTGMWLPQKSIGYGGILIALCAWLSVMVSLRSGRNAGLLAVTGLLSLATFWTILYLLYALEPIGHESLS